MRRTAAVATVATSVLACSITASGQGLTLSGARPLSDAEATSVGGSQTSLCIRSPRRQQRAREVASRCPGRHVLGCAGAGRTAEVIVGDCLVEIAVTKGTVSWVLYRGAAKSAPTARTWRASRPRPWRCRRHNPQPCGSCRSGSWTANWRRSSLRRARWGRLQGRAPTASCGANLTTRTEWRYGRSAFVSWSIL